MIIHHAELVEFRDANLDAQVAYTGGVFDLLHEGHLNLFSHLRAIADVTIVGVTPDSRVQFRKGPGRPAQSQATRLAVVNALSDVDFCFISPDQKDPNTAYIGYQVLKDLRPNVFVTSDVAWEEDRLWLGVQETELDIIPRFRSDISTSQTIARIVAANPSVT